MSGGSRTQHAEFHRYRQLQRSIQDGCSILGIVFGGVDRKFVDFGVSLVVYARCETHLARAETQNA